MVGRPVAIDSCIEALLKGTFARVCVEIDVTKPLCQECLLECQRILTGRNFYMRMSEYFVIDV